jgi:hypothetical protein
MRTAGHLALFGLAFVLITSVVDPVNSQTVDPAQALVALQDKILVDRPRPCHAPQYSCGRCLPSLHVRKANLVHNREALLNGVNKIGFVSVPCLDGESDPNGGGVLTRGSYALDRPFSFFHGILPASHFHAGGRRDDDRRTHDRCREIGLGFLERSQLVQDYLQPLGNVPRLCPIFCSHYRSMPPVAAANSEQN